MHACSLCSRMSDDSDPRNIAGDFEPNYEDPATPPDKMPADNPRYPLDNITIVNLPEVPGGWRIDIAKYAPQVPGGPVQLREYEVSSDKGSLERVHFKSTDKPGIVQVVTEASIMNAGWLGEEIRCTITTDEVVSSHVVCKGAGKGR